MQLRVNGEDKALDVTNLSEVLQALDVRQKYVAVALNGVCVRKDQLAATAVRAGDDIEILVPMQGG